MNYETSSEIQIAVAKWLDYRRLVVVPNLSWGMLDYECDVAALTGAGYLYEVEIKVSKADLLRDRSKRKWKSLTLSKMRKMWFAIPEKLHDCQDLIPECAGILVVDSAGRVEVARAAPTNVFAPKLNDDERFNLARLGAIRVWSLKRKVLDLTTRLMTFDGRPVPPDAGEAKE